MAGALPLCALLSQALVAFTIEFDNEFEHQTPHRTTNHSSTSPSAAAPWLVSMAIWIHFLRFVPDRGIEVGEFQQLTSLTKTELKVWLTRLSKWWGYVAIQRNPLKDPGSWLIQPTGGGQEALCVWRSLTDIVDQRWQERFGKRTTNQLRQSLQALVAQTGLGLPDYLPILRYDMLSMRREPERRARTSGAAVAEYTLPVLLAKTLLALAIEYETESGLSIAISANVLRLSGDGGTAIREMPDLAGVSKEAIAMAVKRLQTSGHALVQPAANESRAKALVLTTKGADARDSYHRLLWSLEQHWEDRWGRPVVDLQQSLERLTRENSAGKPALFEGLEPYADGWRASVRRPNVLPHYPMVLHRGGFPDGS